MNSFGISFFFTRIVLVCYITFNLTVAYNIVIYLFKSRNRMFTFIEKRNNEQKRGTQRMRVVDYKIKIFIFKTQLNGQFASM